MELIDSLHQVIQQSIKAAQLSDLKIGTVTNASPLQITINTNMQPLNESVLLLTANVVEKKIPVLSHSHTISDGATCGSALTSIACIENGTPLPVENGYIILNRALAVNDKVLLLRVQNGQQFIVLSRVF